ncbi:MAG: biotin--[acetyl-CoA-carboxylase] ligase [Bacteroidota bacterium]|nr:biotin--[acetyl-CoA-carboxylase] ligase [Bacteroidota bacterium]
MPPASKKFIILEKVDSTNNYAMGMVQNGVGHSGDAVFAMEQTAGKARRGKTWESEKGQNIALSILVEMSWNPVACQFQLSAAAAVGSHRFFSKYVKEELKIKWPNDIFINDRKAGGILIENVIKGYIWQWAVIGIGLNINQNEFAHQNLRAVSLRQVTGKSFQVIELAKELHAEILVAISDLKNGKFDELLAIYNENLFGRNKQVTLKKGNILFETTIEKISFSGELITNDVMERNFAFDEVEWIL